MAGTNYAPLAGTTRVLLSLNAGSIATGTSSSAPIFVTSLDNLITIRLMWDNFMLWKTHAIPALGANGLYGYVANTVEAPPHTITEGTGDAAIEAANPDFL